VAEYLRRHPKLIAIQGQLKLKLFEVHICADSNGLDISNKHLAGVVGIAWDRLRSSDARRHDQYNECQQLAR